MDLSVTGSDVDHVRMCIVRAEIVFGEHRDIIRNNRLPLSYKVSTYKGTVLAKGTYGCEVVDLTSRTRRKYKVFNAKCLSVLSRRTIAQETSKPSFDILA